MQDTIELNLLRDLYDIDGAIRSLESQLQNTSKEYKQGIRMLVKERASVEAAICDGNTTINNITPKETRSPSLTKLINDPSLESIPQINEE